jgi:hypothetical protein
MSMALYYTMRGSSIGEDIVHVDKILRKYYTNNRNILTGGINVKNPR